jgi:hypothetical protein
VTHCSDDDLVLHYYGDSEAPVGAAAHLVICGDCRDRYDELAASLGMVVFAETPDPGERYGLELWRRLEPRLTPQLPPRQPVWRASWFRPLSVAAAAILLLVTGFVAGRVAPGAPPPRASAAIDAGQARRVLMMSVADHLERSDRMLTNIMNASIDGDISAEQMSAADLISDNRFYRQDAAASDEQAVAAVLDELERALLDIVHGPSVATKADLEQMHRRLDSAALLFKVRVLSGELRDRQLDPPAPVSQPSTSRIS